MMQLTLKAISANLYTLIRRGVRIKSASSRGGSAKKKIEDLVPALISLIQTRKQKSASSLWNHLVKKHEGEESAMVEGNTSIWIVDDCDKKLLFVADGLKEPESITFSTFKRYVAEAKRRLASL